MQTINLQAENREQLSRGRLNSLRSQGWIPAILYGTGTKEEEIQNVMLKINEKAFLKTVGDHKSSNIIVELQWDTQTTNAVIKEVQHDILSRKIIHIDFKRISLTEKIEVMVPVLLTGEAPGVKLHGGILEHITREVKMSCLPKDIPARIDIDISKLDIGQSILVKDIPAIPGVEILSDPHSLITNIVAPTILEEVAPATTAVPGANEPEVIAKGKKPEEGAAATPAKPTPPAGK